MQELAEQFLLRGQRHERVVWLAFKKRLDEGNGALRIVMPQPVEIHQHRMGATGLLFAAGGPDLAPGAHQIVRRERLESRLDVLFAGAGVWSKPSCWSHQFMGLVVASGF